jgi:hypothetical protein
VTGRLPSKGEAQVQTPVPPKKEKDLWSVFRGHHWSTQLLYFYSYTLITYMWS